MKLTLEAAVLYNPRGSLWGNLRDFCWVHFPVSIGSGSSLRPVCHTDYNVPTDERIIIVRLSGLNHVTTRWSLPFTRLHPLASDIRWEEPRFSCLTRDERTSRLSRTAIGSWWRNPCRTICSLLYPVDTDPQQQSHAACSRSHVQCPRRGLGKRLDDCLSNFWRPHLG